MSSRNLDLSLTLRAKNLLSQVVQSAFRTVEQESRTGARAVEDASRRMGNAARARELLEVRSQAAIRREIQQTEAAYNRLARAGFASSAEQGRALEAMRSKVVALRREMDGVGRAQRAMQLGGSVVNAWATAGGAVLGAGYVAAQPIKRVMDYDTRLRYMANTAYGDQNRAGRRAGKQELDVAIRKAVREGGGTKEGAAETLDALLASGAMSQKSATTLLPTLQKYSTASGTGAQDLAAIAIRAKQTFGLSDDQIPLALDKAIKAGKAGGFELKDMAKWLPQQMATAKQAGMSGMTGLDTLLAANQASAITAGTKDEAGNNLVNLLAKINSQDTANDAKKLKINLTGTLAKARERGINGLDAFVGIVDKVVGKNADYQKLQKKLEAAKGDERKAMLESIGNLLQGSAVGKLVQDRQALMALVGYMNNRGYVKDIRGQLQNAKGTGEEDYAFIAEGAGAKVQKALNEKDFAEVDSFAKASEAVGDIASKLADYAQAYPGLTQAIVTTTTAMNVLAAASVAAGAGNLLTGGAGSKLAGSVLGRSGALVRGGGAMLGRAVTGGAGLVVGAGAAGWEFGSWLNGKLTGALTKANGGKDMSLGTWLYEKLNGDKEKGLLEGLNKQTSALSDLAKQPIKLESRTVLQIDGRTLTESVNTHNTTTGRRG